ncbi:tRNA (N6-threonylcarbamoyladenosine(37)-N6)-methyltransferase TrmO [Roseibium polysiphoniae]|uniref:tRNA (N6-threonylcarbamoyladenosine(37)-N6)-methyltransferase TrmO n=1 Tax=Roseibium polysiphoniae TaxID=2571221 RepID=A0ABR9C8M3_9HYPH|nr:tRNA (N6-threonylcarbamoyladenosine(37)-N6)-methyltransferase TrmO [Roseibium polysiphoniae]MBD8876235.1 tRNA (N6-threonylcarbamoyladenosine(37)-N6)-methyltransferase TrmO [Roseibium polysiphoniae]
MPDSARSGEKILPQDPADMPADAGLVFIGHIATPWQDRHACPRSGGRDDDICTIHLNPRYQDGLKSVESCSHLIILYWMHEARRDIIVQAPAFDSVTHGCFALRSPVRPNPVSLSVVELVSLDGCALKVRGLDCLDGTPLIDIKPYFPRNDSVPEATVGWHGQRSHPERRSTDL